MTREEMTVIGATTLMDIIGVINDVPAKVDTGADSSAIWASNVHVDANGVLHYVLFDTKSPLYNGIEYTTRKFAVAGVVSSSGHRQVRYRITLPVRIKGRRINVAFNLSNRSRNQFPVLVGKRTLRRRFLVDVSDNPIKPSKPKTRRLNEEMKKNPHEFFQKYHQSIVKNKE